VLDVYRCAYALYRRLGFIEVRRLIEGPAVRIRMIAAPWGIQSANVQII